MIGCRISLGLTLFLGLAITAPGHAGTAVVGGTGEAGSMPLLYAHQRNYLLPLAYNAMPHTEPWDRQHPEQDMEDIEFKFQVSFKALVVPDLFGAELWGAYSQRSWWQLYAENSAPFRESNYEPEVFLRWAHSQQQWLGMTLEETSLGFNHLSNGLGGVDSRAWNRILGSARLKRGDWLLVPRLWWRLPEPGGFKENPDIHEYLGYGDLTLAHTWGEQRFSARLINNWSLSDNRSSLELDWSFPAGRVRGYVQYYYGFGESLIDYDHRVHRLGVGILLSDWM